jgi:pre-rRNA-processing protein IPI1
MAKSSKAKKEKKQDFQKTKLKVGKTKPKAANFTNTSFKAKCKLHYIVRISLMCIAISVSQQSLSTSAPSASSQFSHHLGLLNHKSDTQRKESLAHLISSLKDADQLPLPASSIVSKVRPALLDSSASIRSQAIKLLELLPAEAVIDNAEQLLLYAHVTMTHLSPTFRLVGLDLMEWLLNVAGDSVVGLPGGWSRSLECFLSVLGWSHLSKVKSTTGWSAAGAQPSKAADDEKLKTRGLQVLAVLLQVGLQFEAKSLQEQQREAAEVFPLHQARQYLISTQGNPYGYLGLFDDTGKSRLEDVTERQVFFAEHAAGCVEIGVEQMKKEGGRVGRASVEVEKALKLRVQD